MMRPAPAANPTASIAGEPALNEYSGESRATTSAATPISSPPNPVNFRAAPLHTSSIIPHAREAVTGNTPAAINKERDKRREDSS